MFRNSFWHIVEKMTVTDRSAAEIDVLDGWLDEALSRSGSRTSISAAERSVTVIFLYYVPEAVAKHTGGHSIAELDSREAAVLLVS